MTDPDNPVPKPYLSSLPKPRIPPTEFGDRKVRRLHLNECPYQPSPKVKEAVAEAAESLNLYPDGGWTKLAEALATHWDWPADRIVCTNGSDELLMLSAQMSLSPGTEAVAPGPCFPGYPRAVAAQGAKLIQVPVRADGGIDVAATLDAVTEKTRLVFITTPMNPTGTLMTAEEIATLLREIPDHALAVLDEAYYELGRHAGGPDHGEALAARKGPWVVLRTFSKAYGLAGLRLGYALCGSEAIKRSLDNLRITLNVSRLSQAGALAALSDPAHTSMILDKTAQERARLTAGLEAAGCPVLPSATNFIAARLPGPAADVVRALREEADILTQAIPYPGFEDWIRISIGNAEDTDAVLSRLPALLGGPDRA